jgi:hypothetical protein
MRVLPSCVVRGAYRFARTTPATDHIEIKSDDELYAKLPLGAASLEGELSRSGRLDVQTTVAGYQRLVTEGAFALEGRCAEATHVVSGLAVGAFTLESGASGKASATAEVLSGSAGAKRSAEGELLRRAGDPERCAGATDVGPDPACASPIQLFLVPVEGGVAAPPGGGPGAVAVGRAPPTEVPISVHSEDPGVAWDVYVDGAAACQTPCDRLVPARSTLRLQERRFFLARESTATVRDLDDWAAAGGVRIEARSTSFWNLGGLTRMGGLFYALIGAGFLVPCLSSSEDADRYCMVSGITFAVGIPLFAVGTWVMDAPGSAGTSPLR